MSLLNMVKFEFKLMSKTSVMVLSFFAYPVVLTLIIGYLTYNNFGSGISSYDYYSIGMMIFIYSGAGLASVYNFIGKPIKQGNLRVIFTPIKTTSIYLSQIICGTIFCAAGAAFTMAAFNVLFGINYNGNEFIIFSSFVTLIFMSNALGVLLCIIIDNDVTINMIFNTIQTVFCVLGGAFFSLESLGKIPAAIAKISPVKWVMDGMLNSIYDNNNFLLYITIAINIVLGVILIAFCKCTFKTEKYL
ncbi:MULTISPECIES: ABC transporter permease [Clostridium]|uniref:ABC transporter permease n=1 Tax=Clostridium TaxID=1485 RepID=UPI0008268D08|nr:MULTISPECIES: ABC transporter permease [Clostridium]PJI09453.1 ABC transporter permease [Clostridium sp. CT7]